MKTQVRNPYRRALLAFVLTASMFTSARPARSAQDTSADPMLTASSPNFYLKSQTQEPSFTLKSSKTTASRAGLTWRFPGSSAPESSAIAVLGVCLLFFAAKARKHLSNRKHPSK